MELHSFLMPPRAARRKHRHVVYLLKTLVEEDGHRPSHRRETRNLVPQEPPATPAHRMTTQSKGELNHQNRWETKANLISRHVSRHTSQGSRRGSQRRGKEENPTRSRAAKSLDPASSYLCSSSLALEHAPATQRSWRSLSRGRTAASTLRAPPGPTNLRAAVKETKNPNPKLAKQG